MHIFGVFVVPNSTGHYLKVSVWTIRKSVFWTQNVVIRQLPSLGDSTAQNLFMFTNKLWVINSFMIIFKCSVWLESILHRIYFGLKFLSDNVIFHCHLSKRLIKCFVRMKFVFGLILLEHWNDLRFTFWWENILEVWFEGCSPFFLVFNVEFQIKF